MQDPERDAAPASPTEIVRRYIATILHERRWNAATLAREAGIAPSTVGRALKDQKFVMTTATLRKLADASGVPVPAALVGILSTGATGLQEAEAAPMSAPVDARTDETPDLDRWQMRGRFLELQGILPGDYLLVSRSTRPRADDVVCAQLYDQAGAAETVFRLYDPPYLMVRTATPDCQRKLQIVDDERAVIVGVVVKVVRVRAP